MKFEFGGTEYEVKDITRAERKELAALRSGLYAVRDGMVWQSGPALYQAIQRVQRLSGLKDEQLGDMAPDTENELFLSLMAAYIEGLAGKPSGA